MKKGFTIPELLAVIIILGVVALIATPVVLNVVESAREKAKSSSLKMYIKAVDNTVMDLKLKGNNIPDGYYSIDSNGNICIGTPCKEVQVKGEKPTSGVIEIKDYEVACIYGLTFESYMVSCDSNKEYVYENPPEPPNPDVTICTGVTSSAKGNVPEGNYVLGDEYICEVNSTTSYNFYVLSTSGNKVSLIMSKNINSSGGPEENSSDGSKWYDLPSGDTITGLEKPTTLISFINSATSGWTNIPNLNELYVDESGAYGIVNLTGKARPPKLSELQNAGCGMSTDVSAQNGPTWIWINLKMNPFSTLSTGYWILPSSGDLSTNKSKSYSINVVGKIALNDKTSVYGVRPVIEVLKSNLSE